MGQLDLVVKSQSNDQTGHKSISYPIYDCLATRFQGDNVLTNCTILNQDSCDNDLVTSDEIVIMTDCEDFEKTTQMQVLILFAISTSVSLLNLGGLLIVYDKDPEIDEIPNLAERQRASSG